MNFYNEIDHKSAAWIRELIKAGEIPDGVVDERSITELKAADLAAFTQVHLFAGISGWSYALRLAGFPATRRIFTGSCPCQPYSTAGKGEGDADPRNLWPQMFRLVRECRPDLVIGEQVEAAIGHGWLDGISADLEGEDYAVGPIVLGAHSAGKDHIRQRLLWMAYTAGAQRGERSGCRETVGVLQQSPELRPECVGMADAGRIPARRRDGPGDAQSERSLGESSRRGDAGRLANAEGKRLVTRCDVEDHRTAAGEGDASGSAITTDRLAHASRGGLGIDGCAPGIGRHADQRGESRGLADSASPSGAQQRQEPGSGPRRGTGPDDATEHTGPDIRLADTDGGNASTERQQRSGQQRQQPQDASAVRLGNAIDTRLEGFAGNGDRS
jgi:hypothetical protein